jgi:hypothetical protein
MGKVPNHTKQFGPSLIGHSDLNDSDFHLLLPTNSFPDVLQERGCYSSSRYAQKQLDLFGTDMWNYCLYAIPYAYL